MSYRLFIKPSARRELEELEGTSLQRVDQAILRLATDPRPRGTVKLTGLPLYRVRAGDYRVLYEIDDQQRQVAIVGVRHRREAYRS